MNTMFDNVTVSEKLQNTHSNQPSPEECHEILIKLNNDNAVERVEAIGVILTKLDEAYQYSREINDGKLNCHTVTRYLSSKFSCNSFKQSYGYLCALADDGHYYQLSLNIDLNSLDNGKEIYIQQNQIKEILEINPPIVTLEHHSVILDNSGNYFECLIENYPLKKYIFISHDSGQYGCNLKAHVTPQS
jgi:hypothetical protein